MKVPHKHLTDHDLAKIVKKAVTENIHLDDYQAYMHFLKDLAGVITNYFGGTIEEAKYDSQRKEWLAVVRHDENVPEGGGIYEDFDQETDWRLEEP